MLEVTVCK